MAIYFPRGFNSGEPVRVVGGITVVRGKLAKQHVDLVVIGAERGLLGGPKGKGAAAARAVLRAAGDGAARALSERPRAPGSLHLLPAGKLGCRMLGFFERPGTDPSTESAASCIRRIAEVAARNGAKEVAIGPFGADPEAAVELARVLRDRHGAARPDEPRWVLVVSSRSQFEAATR